MSSQIERVPPDRFDLHPSGIYLPRKKRPTAVDLFCGCGGMSLGFIQAGWEVVAAVDWDPLALITYMTNLGSYPMNIHGITDSDKKRLNKALEREFGMNKKGKISRAFLSGSGWISGSPESAPVRNVWIGDVRKLRGQDILDALGMKRGEIDCVMGGPPCQGFSSAGRRQVMDPRNSLVFDFARLVLEIQPKTMMMENVPGILSMVTPEGVPVIDALCRILEDGNFGTYEALKKSLLMSSGQGAALRGKPKAKREEPEDDEAEFEQLAIF